MSHSHVITEFESTICPKYKKKVFGEINTLVENMVEPKQKNQTSRKNLFRLIFFFDKENCYFDYQSLILVIPNL